MGVDNKNLDICGILLTFDNSRKENIRFTDHLEEFSMGKSLFTKDRQHLTMTGTAYLDRILVYNIHILMTKCDDNVNLFDG